MYLRPKRLIENKWRIANIILKRIVKQLCILLRWWFSGWADQMRSASSATLGMVLTPFPAFLRHISAVFGPVSTPMNCAPDASAVMKSTIPSPR